MNPPINDGGPAFPASCSQDGIPLVVSYPKEQVSGMSLRDWFAGQALNNLYTQEDNNPHRVAIYAYEIADAMLAARNSKP